MFRNFIHIDEEHSHNILGQQGRKIMLFALLFFVLVGPIFELLMPYHVNIVTRVLIYALFALSLDFAFGIGGLPSFGHAAMFGVAGYGGGLLAIHFTNNFVAIIILALLLGLVVAAVMAALTVHTRGIYFAMLSLAFAQILYMAAVNDLPMAIINALTAVEPFGQWFGDMNSVTGGGDGVIGIPRPEIFGISFRSTLLYYYVTLMILSLAVIITVRFANSPFGRVLQAINQNEDRVSAVGYNVRRYKIIAFSISGAFAGLAGGLYVPLTGIAHPGLIHWLVSGILIIYVLFGGIGTLWGPMVAAAIDIYTRELLLGTEYWQIVLGVLYIVVVIFAPKGIAGIILAVSNDPNQIPERVKHAIANYIRQVVR